MDNSTNLRDLINMRGPGRPVPEEAADHRWSDYLGLELELEGIYDPPRVPWWVLHEDGSLRSGWEYVSEAPLYGEDMERSLDSFYDLVDSWDANPRTSTHIHVDFSQETVGTLRSMVVIVYALEAGLYDVIGVDRKWAGYAAPLREMTVNRLRNLLSPDASTANFEVAVGTGRGNERYYGLNISSLRRHGSMEFRYFPGGPDREELESWMDLVLAIKRMAKEVTLDRLEREATTPRDMVSLFAGFLPRSFMENLLSCVPVEDIFHALWEAMAVAERTPEYQREVPLIFLNPMLVKVAANRHNLSEEGKLVLQRAADTLGVVSLQDWNRILSDAKGTSSTSTSNPFRDEILSVYTGRISGIGRFYDEALSSGYEEHVDEDDED